MTPLETLETVRHQVRLHVILNHRDWSGLYWTGYGRFVLVRPGSREQIDVQGPYTWYDGGARRRDAFELFCVLSEIDPSGPPPEAVQAFLQLAGTCELAGVGGLESDISPP